MRETVVNEHGECVVRISAPNLAPLTREQIEMIEAASKKEYVYDEDCPPMDEELLQQMERDISSRAGAVGAAVGRG